MTGNHKNKYIHFRWLTQSIETPKSSKEIGLPNDSLGDTQKEKDEKGKIVVHTISTYIKI